MYKHLTFDELLALYHASRAEKQSNRTEKQSEREREKKEEYEFNHPTFTDEQWMKYGEHVREVINNDAINEGIRTIYIGIAHSAAQIKILN